MSVSTETESGAKNAAAGLSQERIGSTIGLIGLGLMGRALGEKWIANGGQVLGHDIAGAAVAGFRAVGGLIANDSAAVFTACDRVLLSLPTDCEVRQVLREASGAFRAGQLVVDTTTGDPANTEALAKDLSVQGLDYLDATISGSSEQLRRGETFWMVGGRMEAVERCADLFQILARQTVHTGPCGTGARMKLVTNLVLGLNRAALAEGLAFAGALGLGLRETLEVLRSSMAYSRVMDGKGPKMVQGDFEPQARLSQHLKDVRLILKTSVQAGQPLPLSESHRGVLELAEKLGLGHLDNSAVLRAIESQRSPSERP